ncbi:MAG: ATP-binding protein, partial [Cyanobacteria bacterium J06621_15]
MTKQTPVPLLDLAPKLKRPLSLWNPLDYLRLLYWVFYFPQALRWYVDTFGGGYISEGEMNWRKGWKLLQENAIHRNLFLQGLLLTIITPLLLSRLLQCIGISVSWIGLVFGVVCGVAFSSARGKVFSIFGVASYLALGVGLGFEYITFDFILRLSQVVTSIEIGIVLGLGFGVASNVPFGVVNSLANSVARGVALGVGFGVGFSVASVGVYSFFSVLYIVGLIVSIALLVVYFGVLSVVASSVTILRPDSWLIGLSLNIPNLQKSSLLFLRITSLPIPFLSFRLRKWLQQDWETGVYNANQLLVYTLQFFPVIRAVNQVLAKTPAEQIIYRVSQLAEAPFDWKLVGFFSAKIKFLFNPFNYPLKVETPLDTEAHATAAGFWYLHEKEPAKAEEAFFYVRSILYGEEMYKLAKTLADFHKAFSFNRITRIPIDNLHINSLKSSQENLFRSTTWQAIFSLYRVVEDAQVIQRSVSRVTRSFALNQAQGELTNILNNPQNLPEVERGLIIDIAETWQKALLQKAGEVGEISITKPVRNPYTIGDPVMGEKFVGREEVMRELKELWVMSEQLQSVVIFGHRRMGKTSILRNAANSTASGVKVAYVNMLNAG